MCLDIQLCFVIEPMSDFFIVTIINYIFPQIGLAAFTNNLRICRVGH